jgi:tripartite-type tricarboxylate transporter receptor subunit TctC
MRAALHSAVVVCVTLSGVLAGVGRGDAEEWPAHPIRVIVPLSAGSAVDIIPRIVFEELTTRLGQPIYVENRTGASGTIGTRSVANAPADGYTLLAHSSAFAISPTTVANAGYDAVTDFVAVAPLGNLPNVLVISPAKQIRTANEFVAFAKKSPITFGSVGTGSPIHLATERFRLAAGFEAQAIPFRGAPEALTEVMADRVDVYDAPLTSALPFIRAGKLVPLAVSSSHRASTLPDVPTTIEAGYPNSDYNFWIAVFAPAGTPQAIVDTLNREINAVVASPAVHEKLAKLGVDPMPMTTAQFDQFLRQEVAANAGLAKTLGLIPQ